MQVETGELPLFLRRSQQEIKYSVKVKATKGHPASSVTEFHWTTLRNLQLAIFQYIQKLSNILRTHLYSSTETVNSPVLPDEPPWHLKECIVDTCLINCGKKQENPQLLKALAMDKIDSYKEKNSLHIYTDASKTIDNKTSAAFCVSKS